MLKLKLIVAVCALAAAVHCKLHSTSLDVQPDWVETIRPESSELIKFRVPLVQRNLKQLEATILDRADPNSPRYSEWLTTKEVTAMVSPAKADVKRVASWLQSSGMRTVDTSRGDVILVEGTVGNVEKMLNARFAWYSHPSGKSRLRTLSYSVPAELDDIVEFVAGISELWVAPKRQRLGPNDAAPRMADGTLKDNDVTSGYVIPASIRNLYSIPSDAFRDVSALSSVCTAEFQDDPSWYKSDLQGFETGTGEISISVDHIVGPYGSGQDAEAELDIQYASAIGLNSTYWFWTVDLWMLEFAQDLYTQRASPAGGPDVVTMSWGWPTQWQCQIGNCSGGITSYQYAARVDAEWMKLTSTGVTLCASSGDQGAPGDINPSCSNHKTPISDLYPGASPWVTSVGATMLTPGQTPKSGAYPNAPVCNSFPCATGTQEQVCTTPAALITTGGGFSTMSPMPAWQSSIVKQYLTSGVTLPPSWAFNSSNRGFPDVSANGHAYLINMGGFMQVDGTSCSSPVFAGIVTLLNGARINAGKTSLGFINPALYNLQAATPSAFNSFSTGNNFCTEDSCCKYGFSCTSRSKWNPVVGLGTPNFPALLTYFTNLK